MESGGKALTDLVPRNSGKDVVGGRSTHGIPPERVFKAIHIGFLAAGLMDSAGTVFTAPRSEGRTH
jgi:hypothetical protein